MPAPASGCPRTSLVGRVRRLVFGISPEEASCSRRGFRGGDAAARGHIEHIGRTFIEGYHVALEEGSADPVARRLEAVPAGMRGFAFEGAAMGFALLDRLTPWRRNRLRQLIAGPGAGHVYMLHVGAGWAAARLPLALGSTLDSLDPLLRWLAVDGYGFHEGYFHWRRSVEQGVVPRRLQGYARRAFDQGLGRSLWFVELTDVERIRTTIARFDEERRADLWSGVGLACTYAGGVDRVAVEALVSVAGVHRPELAQGAAFAAKARLLPGLASEHTEVACQLICGMPAETAAAATDEALADLPPDGAEPAFEVWRGRLRGLFASPVVPA